MAASSNNGKAGEIVAGTVIPVVLNVGITHTVAEIRTISMKTLSELIDGSGARLATHLPHLIPCLLKATGELEIPKLSYLSNQMGGNSDLQEEIDSVRAEMAKQHQATETLTKCIRYIDYDTFEKMTPDIIDIINKSVNLGTRIACAHFVCLVITHLDINLTWNWRNQFQIIFMFQITVRFQNEMQPLVSKYLFACFNSLQDRNNTVRKYYASAIGHLIGVAKVSKNHKL